MDRMPLGRDELVEHWTLLDDERELIAGKRGPTRLGFALLLKFFTGHRRFPSGRSELPDEAIEFVARQVKVPAAPARRRQRRQCAQLAGEGRKPRASSHFRMSRPAALDDLTEQPGPRIHGHGARPLGQEPNGCM